MSMKRPKSPFCLAEVSERRRENSKFSPEFAPKFLVLAGRKTPRWVVRGLRFMRCSENLRAKILVIDWWFPLYLFGSGFASTAGLESFAGRQQSSPDDVFSLIVLSYCS